MMKTFLLLACLAVSSAYEIQFPLLAGDNAENGLGIYRKRCHLQEVACTTFCLKSGELIKTYKCDPANGNIDPCECSKGSFFTAPAAFAEEVVAAAPNAAPLPPAGPVSPSTASPSPAAGTSPSPAGGATSASAFFAGVVMVAAMLA